MNIERHDRTNICVFGQGQHSILTVSTYKQSVTFDFLFLSLSTETNGVRMDYASLDVLCVFEFFFFDRMIDLFL